MKKIILLACIAFGMHASATAQYTAGDRYQKKVFSSYDSVINIKYGANATASSATPQDLFLNVYMPAGDTAQRRPVIFFTHGGSFVTGSRESLESTYFCREFAKRGYVTVSQSYRLGLDSYDAGGATRAVWRAMQDGRAAVRYMRSRAADFNLDTNMFIYGGTSAGGFIALQAAFLDKPGELLPGIDTTLIGGFEGTTNNLTNSSKIQAVINLCGALGDTSWIEHTDSAIPVLSTHGTNDDVVPYDTRVIVFLGFLPLIEVDGSSTIRTRLNNLGFPNRFYTYCGGGHVPFTDNNAQGRLWLDSTVALINQFVYEDVLKCGTAEVRIRDIDSVDCALTGIDYSQQLIGGIYPNPANDRLTIQLNTLQQVATIEIIDLTGKSLIKNMSGKEDAVTIGISHLNTGLYFVRIHSGSHIQVEKIWKN